jgi:hypothetical protein
MDSHASESYFVIGEGLLTESAGGRDDGAGATRIASATTRASAAPTRLPVGISRFAPRSAV